MQKIILTVLTVSLNSITFCVLVQMPDAQTLHERLNKKGLGDFATKSNIIAQLQNKQLESLAIAQFVEEALSHFDIYLETKMSPEMAKNFSLQLHMNKPMLYKALLMHCQESLDELHEIGIYQPFWY